MKWRWLTFGLLLATLLILLGCTAIRGPQAAAAFHVEVSNQSPKDICYVYISLSEMDSWGDNHLSSNETIAPNESQKFGLEEGTYDVKVENCDQVVMASAWEISSDTKLDVGKAGATASFLVENTSDVEVCFIYVAPIDKEDWGEDWLGEMESFPSGARRLFFIEPGIYDLMAVDCDGNPVDQEYVVNLNEDVSWVIE